MRMNVNIGTRGAKRGCTILRATLDPTPAGENTVSVKNVRSVRDAMMERRRMEAARKRIRDAGKKDAFLEAMAE